MLREPPIKTQTSFEEFLEFESTSQVRHEFVDGNLFVMAGGTDRHNLIALTLMMLIFRSAQESGFYALNDVLLKTPSGQGYYPDLYVVPHLGEAEARVKRHPHIIIEVLSESTEAIDRGEKWQAYQQIPSLQQYILLSQREPLAETFVRHDSQWLYSKLGNDDVLRLPSLQCEIILSSLYENLPLLES